MTEPDAIQIDARGTMCPRPIIELAKARRRAEPGAVIEVQADDLAFESDVQAWCDTTGNPLLELSEDDGVYVARIRIAPAE